jgi:hypothetical protein
MPMGNWRAAAQGLSSGISIQYNELACQASKIYLATLIASRAPSLLMHGTTATLVLRAWRSNERTYFLALLSIGPLDQFTLMPANFAMSNVAEGPTNMVDFTPWWRA